MSIIRPNENDVLLGRGGRNHEHSGNEQLRRIAHSRVREYRAATKKQKAVISRQILNQLQSMEPNGRFLLKNYSTYEWDVVKDAVAREKVCQALRDAVAIERDAEKEKRDVVPMDPLPDTIDVLCSEQFDRKKRLPISGPIVTPVKHESEEDSYSEETYPTAVKLEEDQYNDETYHYPVKEEVKDDDNDEEAYRYRSGLSDDFDLFNGELLKATDDEALTNQVATNQGKSHP